MLLAAPEPCLIAIPPYFQLQKYAFLFHSAKFSACFLLFTIPERLFFALIILQIKINAYFCIRLAAVQWCNGSTTGFGSVCGGS
ncbi:MAG: hypothetical protein J1F13_07005, partial [Prevotellaceae bacterium]|nr:hypothetical protein [Prevotellaceae bacterium]